MGGPAPDLVEAAIDAGPGGSVDRAVRKHRAEEDSAALLLSEDYLVLACVAKTAERFSFRVA